MLSGEVARALRPRGTAGRHHPRASSRAPPARASAPSSRTAITFELEGEANDYVGKGLSGGRIVIYPPQRRARSCRRTTSSSATPCCTAPSPARRISAAWRASASAVRNSGATAVVEGVGDHGCEYMTGGTVVVLGTAGRNFAAGMSRRHRLRARRGRRLRAALQPRDGGARAVPEEERAAPRTAPASSRATAGAHRPPGRHDDAMLKRPDRAPPALHRQRRARRRILDELERVPAQVREGDADEYRRALARSIAPDGAKPRTASQRRARSAREERRE